MSALISGPPPQRGFGPGWTAWWQWRLWAAASESKEALVVAKELHCRRAILGVLFAAVGFHPCSFCVISIPAIRSIQFNSHGATLSEGGLSFSLTQTVIPKRRFVLVHGSGKIRQICYLLARLLAENGFAVLTYDKRGVLGIRAGIMKGQDNVSAKNLNLLADDASAAMEALEQDSRLKQIPAGFVGVSQAGWIVPLAAVKSPATKFIPEGTLWSGDPVAPSSGVLLHFQDLASGDPDFWKTRHTQQQVVDLYKIDDAISAGQY